MIRQLWACTFISLMCVAARGDLPQVRSVDAQPLIVQVQRLVEALDYLGTPLSPQTRAALAEAVKQTDSAAVTEAVQRALDPYCLLGVQINPESRVKVEAGPAEPRLVEDGWRQFLVKVQNQAGVTAPLKVISPQAMPMFNSPAEEVGDRWLEMQLFDDRPAPKKLTGLELEYRIIQLYSRDAGKRAAVISFNVGQGTQDIGYRNDVPVTFTADPAAKITLHVTDENGQPATASFTIRDAAGRSYPSQAKRLAPDFAFHPQVYRNDGESVKLPAGRYTISVARGPEYRALTREVELDGSPRTLDFKLDRWIDPSKFGYWSGDHHIHAAGCAHYTKPTEGVHAPDMALHCRGEDLKIGANLTWGPCFDYQKQFFTGHEDKVSQYPYLIRYDIEVSGFGSHKSGHLCLLRLTDEMYPGGDSKDHWPTLCLNTYRWAKKQGAVCGPAHSGWGLSVSTDDLPSYVVPPFDGIGANEYIVDVTHMVDGPGGAKVPCVDFISTVDTPAPWELNIWYHTLNCGFRTRISGETDFPCIYGERVGLGRGYFKVDGKLTYDQWVESIRLGRGYVGDGRSHLIDFSVNGQVCGEKGSELRLASAGKVHVTAKAAALLSDKPDATAIPPKTFTRPYGKAQEKPFWTVERARIPGTNRVMVELIVNGYAVDKKPLDADGRLRDIAFDAAIDKSSWVALRVLPSSHTNPVFIVLDEKPIRASRRSAEWCAMGVEKCWSQKKSLIAAPELKDAEEAYDHARRVYKQIIEESQK